jgi:hypothetical protein
MSMARFRNRKFLHKFDGVSPHPKIWRKICLKNFRLDASNPNKTKFAMSAQQANFSIPTQNQSMGDRPKKPKLIWTEDRDVELLKQVQAVQPHEANYGDKSKKWQMVASRLSSHEEFYGVNVRSQACSERFQKLEVDFHEGLVDNESTVHSLLKGIVQFPVKRVRKSLPTTVLDSPPPEPDPISVHPPSLVPDSSFAHDVDVHVHAPHLFSPVSPPVVSSAIPRAPPSISSPSFANSSPSLPSSPTTTQTSTNKPKEKEREEEILQQGASTHKKKRNSNSR